MPPSPFYSGRHLVSALTEIDANLIVGPFTHLVVHRRGGSEVFIANQESRDESFSVTVVTAEEVVFTRRRDQLEFLADYPFCRSAWRTLTYLVGTIDAPEQYSPEVLLNLASLSSAETCHLAVWIQELRTRVCDHLRCTQEPGWTSQFRRWRANLFVEDLSAGLAWAPGFESR